MLLQEAADRLTKEYGDNAADEYVWKLLYTVAAPHQGEGQEACHDTGHRDVRAAEGRDSQAAFSIAKTFQPFVGSATDFLQGYIAKDVEPLGIGASARLRVNPNRSSSTATVACSSA